MKFFRFDASSTPTSRPSGTVVSMLSAFIVVIVLLCAGCRVSIDYSDPDNWLVCGEGGDGTAYDVFYVYPTLFADRDKVLMDRSDDALMDKARDFARNQTGMFMGRARVYAPFVRQLEYGRCLAALGAGREIDADPDGAVGVRDTAAAFDFYMRRFNRGRPFVLLGHSQGAMDLYAVLRLDRSIGPEGGLAAAYLVGLPQITAERMLRDFSGRRIRPAAGERDFGVVVGWNTQSRNAKSRFTGPGVYCINPLNWRCDGVPAPAELNSLTRMYDFRTKTAVESTRFCGAAVDPARGALIVDLPEKSQYDAGGLMGPGVFHASDIWLFYGNIAENADRRVAALMSARETGDVPEKR